ncbi:hypothetical protein FIBSPDRAFT_892544 [Athelia psychrophila]|uniref:Uncharacterized protein n=1 Tax=Athelia psychrophila TaxID=1759441 RepID=A0A166I949_9AGAM|nr:hypothetical protein FIBSPDRAFT_892544 [Fibularhizoctonia sp. CBS 109695]
MRTRDRIVRSSEEGYREPLNDAHTSVITVRLKEDVFSQGNLIKDISFNQDGPRGPRPTLLSQPGGNKNQNQTQHQLREAMVISVAVPTKGSNFYVAYTLGSDVPPPGSTSLIPDVPPRTPPGWPRSGTVVPLMLDSSAQAEGFTPGGSRSCNTDRGFGVPSDTVPPSVVAAGPRLPVNTASVLKQTVETKGQDSSNANPFAPSRSKEVKRSSPKRTSSTSFNEKADYCEQVAIR